VASIRRIRGHGGQRDRKKGAPSQRRPAAAPAPCGRPTATKHQAAAAHAPAPTYKAFWAAPWAAPVGRFLTLAGARNYRWVDALLGMTGVGMWSECRGRAYVLGGVTKLVDFRGPSPEQAHSACGAAALGRAVTTLWKTGRPPCGDLRPRYGLGPARSAWVAGSPAGGQQLLDRMSGHDRLMADERLL